MDRSRHSQGMTRRAFGLSFGPGMYVLGMAAAHGAPAPLKKVPTATGIDALFVPFVVAAELKIFEKYGLETSFKPFDDGNVALDALLTGNSDIGATTELGGLSRWDKGGKLYVTSYSSTSGKQIGLAGRDDIKKPEDLIGRTVAYPRATGGHLYFMRYVKKYNLPVDKIKVKTDAGARNGRRARAPRYRCVLSLAALARQGGAARARGESAGGLGRRRRLHAGVL